jgi:hypothetical protein
VKFKMRPTTQSIDDSHDDPDTPLEDKTVAIPLHSKRTSRIQRKEAKKSLKKKDQTSLTHLPTELILGILEYLRPSDVFNISLVNNRLHSLVNANANAIGDEIVRQRYRILSRCFPLPALLSSVEPAVRPILNDPYRQQQTGIHKKFYQHVQNPDPQLLCTCLTCIMTWNNLGLVLDFAHWQDHLDNREPIPVLPRGRTVQWNQDLVERHASIVRRALGDSLYYARILETHLDSTVRSVRRHRGNKGDQRKHVRMTDEEAGTGTDDFLVKECPVSLEFPYNRDEYYMLWVLHCLGGLGDTLR